MKAVIRVAAGFRLGFGDCRTVALPPEPASEVILTLRYATDPMQPFYVHPIYDLNRSILSKIMKKPRNSRGTSSSELPLRGLVISTPGTGKQQFRSLIYRGLAGSRAAGDRRPMRGPNFPLAIFFDQHLRCSRSIIAHSGTTFPGH